MNKFIIHLLVASVATTGLCLAASAQSSDQDFALDPAVLESLPEDVRARLRADFAALVAPAQAQDPDFIRSRTALPNWKARRATPVEPPKVFGQIDEFTYQLRKEDLVRWDNPDIRVPLDINLMVSYPAPIDKRDYRTFDPNAGRVPKELYVAFKPGVAAEDKAKAHALVAGTVTWTSELVPNTYQVRLPEDTVLDAINTYLDQPEVLYAEPHYTDQLLDVPNDPIYGESGSPAPLWGVRSEDFGGTRADRAWFEHQGDQEFVIAVIDSGVMVTHTDLAENIWINPGEIAGNGIDDDGNGRIDDINGWNFADNNADFFLCDNQDHGTHVAGTIAARGDNGYGVVGVNWRARIMVLRCQSTSQCGCVEPNCGLAGTLAAFNYAVARGAKVSNNSYGSPSFNTSVRNAINAAQAAGHIFVAAAGNGGTDGIGDDNDTSSEALFPASYDLPNIISVSAIIPNAFLTRFSNYGVNTVDIGAPGEDITSTSILASVFPTFNSYQGTSMASPHVAGTVALVWSKYPRLSWQQVKEVILTSGDFLTQAVMPNTCGCKLNTLRALGLWYAPVAFPPFNHGSRVLPESYSTLAQRLPLSGPAGGGNWSTVNLMGGTANVGNIIIRGPRFIRSNLSPTVIRP